jgi:hypothetical protein
MPLVWNWVLKRKKFNAFILWNNKAVVYYCNLRHAVFFVLCWPRPQYAGTPSNSTHGTLSGSLLQVLARAQCCLTWVTRCVPVYMSNEARRVLGRKPFSLAEACCSVVTCDSAFTVEINLCRQHVSPHPSGTWLHGCHLTTALVVHLWCFDFCRFP